MGKQWERKDDNASMLRRLRRLLEWARKKHIPIHYRVSVELPAGITLDRLQNEVFPQYRLTLRALPRD